MPLQPSPLTQKGFTLIELLTTVAVLAVIMGIAAPSFSTLWQRWRTEQAISDLESALFYARSEGIRRGGNVFLVRTTPNGACTTGTWECGWSIVFDSDLDGQIEASDEVLQARNALQDIVITPSATGSISFDRWGAIQMDDGNSFNFAIQAESIPASQASHLCILPGGRLQKTKAGVACDS